MWVEIVPKQREKEFNIERLSSQNRDKYELRIVIWNTRGVPLKDGSLDIMVKAAIFDGRHNVDQETDVHFNSKDGRAVFNYRFVFPFQYPNSITDLSLSIYQYNMTSGNEQVGNCKIGMKPHFNRVHKDKSSFEIAREWLPLSILNIKYRTIWLGNRKS